MKLMKNELGREMMEYLNKQLFAVMRKYKVDNRVLNKRVRGLVTGMRYPVIELEYRNGIYIMVVRTDDPRADHFTIYVREDGCEARVPWGFARGDEKEIVEYVERV